VKKILFLKYSLSFDMFKSMFLTNSIKKFLCLYDVDFSKRFDGPRLVGADPGEIFEDKSSILVMSSVLERVDILNV
jgi:hypothetical protein